MNIEKARLYVSESMPSQFKQKCVNCNKEVAVTRKIFLKRLDKVYAMGSDLKSLLESYHCKSCRKTLNVTVIGTERPAKKQGTVKIISTLPDDGV